MTIADPTGWGDRRPVVPNGYRIAAIATDLKIPRQTLVLPNGDILVAEGKGGGDAPALRPKDVLAGYIKKKGTSAVKGGPLTLLRARRGRVYERRRSLPKPQRALCLARPATRSSPTRRAVRFDSSRGRSAQRFRR